MGDIKMETQLDYEDLKSFERRLTEVISSYRVVTLRWRIILTFLSNVTILGAYYWLEDPRTSTVPLTQSLRSHPVFSVSSLLSIFLVLLGKQKLVFAGKLMANRTNGVLRIFNMACDDNGKLKMRLK